MGFWLMFSNLNVVYFDGSVLNGNDSYIYFGIIMYICEQARQARTRVCTMNAHLNPMSHGFSISDNSN